MSLVGFGCLLVLPWLNPIASGPAPSVYPWLVAVACSLMVGVLRTNLDARLIAMTWVVAATTSAWIGLLQYFGYAHVFGQWVHTAGLGEAFANLRQRNQFATLTSIGLLALLWLASQRHASALASKSTDAARWLWLAPLLLALALGNAASSSRTGMLQWCLIFVLAIFWAPRLVSKQVALAAFAFVAYGLGVMLLPSLLEVWSGAPRGGLLARFAGEPGCASRSVLWANALHLIAQKPWLGWGWGELDYAHFATLYPGERFCDILDNAHNLPLHLAVELGLPFAFFSIGLMMWWVRRNRPWAEQQPARQMAWAVLAVIGLHSMLEYPLWYGPFQLAVGLCILILWRTRQVTAVHIETDQRSLVSTTPSRVIEWITVCVCLTALAAAAWDYWRISQLYKPPTGRTYAYRDNTLEKVRNTWFFQDQVQFAELTTVALTPSNALQHYAQAQQLLHFSPEPRVIEAAIESAMMLGKDEEASYYLQRYKTAFPDAHAAWVAKSARFVAP